MEDLKGMVTKFVGAGHPDGPFRGAMSTSRRRF